MRAYVGVLTMVHFGGHVGEGPHDMPDLVWEGFEYPCDYQKSTTFTVPSLLALYFPA